VQRLNVIELQAGTDEPEFASYIDSPCRPIWWRAAISAIQPVPFKRLPPKRF